MPTYEYYCPANHRTVEVMHGMSKVVKTWGELCQAAEQEPGDTPTSTPVEKLLSAGMVVTHASADPTDCGRPGGCCRGACSGH